MPMHPTITKHRVGRLPLPFSLPLALPLSLALCTAGCGGSGSDFGGNESGAGKSELHGTDNSGDQVCADDPSAPGHPPTDIIALDIDQDGDVVVTVTFAGDLESWYADETDKLPFSLQFWTWNDTYIEVFFKSKTEMKVADHKIDVLDYEISGDRLIITLGGIDVENVKTATVSTFVWSYGNWSGSCDDELEVMP